ncbi:hypothetical protein Y032_1026g3424 [Ancylostoma ceylanicum]|nr:hypothetical protein Y032_1026g3424 [Ancylostoma ceylanicum]
MRRVLLKTLQVVIFAETRAHWLITALACFRANLPIVTVYATLGEDAIAHAINETGSSILVTSAELLGKIGTLGKRCHSLRTLIYFPPVNKEAPSPDLTSFRDQFEHVLAYHEVQTRVSTSLKESVARAEDMALIMYTSGTTGAPKGVILLQKNIVAAICGQAHGVGIINDKDTYIGYLPLAHILELDAELTSLCCGCRVGYSSPLTLHDRASKIKPGTYGDCHALRPTLMAAVPAIMDRIFKAVSEEVAASPRIMQELFKLNYERKRARYQEGYCSPFLDRIIFKKIRRLLGGKLKGVLSGGAPLNAETQRFMNICMCCPVVQGYGLTETCGAACVADINDLSTGTVGPPLRCCEIVLREWPEGGYSPFNDPPQGEILITGENVSPGYFKQPDKTAEEFIEYQGKRYFCTGDIGQKRKDGSIIIVDRKKDLVKLQHGEYVSLAKVECALLNCPIIDNVCVYGCSLETNTIALVVPNQKHLEKIAEEVGETSRDLKTMCSNEKITAEFLKRMNEHAKKNRKKDLVKLQHGEYVSLAKVECALLNCPIIDNVCVYGCSLETNTIALVVPNQKHLEKIAEEVGEPSRDLKTMCSNEKITAEFLKRMNEHAKKSKLSKVEMPIAIHLCEEVWTPDSGLLTEALKLKRKPLQVKYQPIIDALYDSIRTAS